MFKVIATGPRAEIEAAWDALAWADPSPADAVDAKEESRSVWRLDAFCADESAAQASIALVGEVAPDLNARAEVLQQRDWVKLSLEGLPAVAAGRFVVAGSHAVAQTAPGKTLIRVDAGPAFGTGHHGTTLGCLMALHLLCRDRPPGRVLDLGTGTGVLAIAALKAGAHSAMATDIDSDSVITARTNAVANAATARFKAIQARGTRHRAIVQSGLYDTVFANILARPLIRLAPEIRKLSAPGAHIILSGLLTHQEPLVRQAYSGQNLALKQRLRYDGWSTLVYRVPA